MDNLACLTDPELLVDVVELLVLEAVEVPVAELIDLLAAVAFALELHQTCPASEAAVMTEAEEQQPFMIAEEFEYAIGMAHAAL
ncbi:uncharacterized protein N7473_006975 [Penicillium subrubescens]|uniref:uncharacterized protein n=1 Tax=Penicillium subrubescens TaxID=1316194 RepID=UPI002544EEDE|nr:uncharacterized protein N7473_006975 [Penicillium subrubescens]KAJ5890747.1 hypothetical protein N7473_006975 [Penicillium subrubescens]